MLPFFQLFVDPVCVIYNSVYLYIVAGSCPFFVSWCLYFPLFLPFSLSVLLSFCLSYSSIIIGLSLPSLFLGLVPFCFFCFLLFLFPLLVYCFVVLCFPCGLCSRVVVSITMCCCCSLRPRILYFSGRKHRYGIWMYWMMAIREERSI